MKARAGLIVGLGAMVGALVATPASATMQIQKKAKDAGFAEATACTYCHVDKLPKKGAATPNDRGKFLIGQKEKNKAKEVDPAWLKDYTEKK